MILDSINDPSDLRVLSQRQLVDVVDQRSRRSGHLDVVVGLAAQQHLAVLQAGRHTGRRVQLEGPLRALDGDRIGADLDVNALRQHNGFLGNA
jgi:hypothetical protein